MKAVVAVVCLAGAGALWYWALLSPKAVDPLEERYQGTFELFRYEPPEGEPGDDPLARKHRWIYTLGADHLYTIRILVGGGFEMAQRAGVVTRETSPEGADYLILTQHTMNASPAEAVPDRYLAEWGSDEKGPYLHLTGILSDRRGQQLFLRRVTQ